MSVRTKKVNRYWCDFCKKASLSSGAMRKHESRCTLNPERVCRMCSFIGNEQPELCVIMDLLPNPEDYRGEFGEFSGSWDAVIADAMKNVRATADNCPCCIMAALRQRKIPLPTVESFDFKAECVAIFAVVNEARHQDELERERHYI